MNKERQKIFLAALLHDIGKFYQRADKPYWESEKLNSTSKNLAGMICPQQDRGGVRFPSHLHVIWTNDFLEQYLKEHLDSLGFRVNPFDANAEIDDNLINLSIYHHRPRTKLQGLIQMADHWASGIDRTKKSEEEAQEPGKFFKKIPLLSVFSQIQPLPEKEFYTKATAQNLNDDIFPIKDAEYEPDYATAWSDFLKDVKEIPKGKDNDKERSAFIDSLLFALKKHTSTLPASTFKKDLPSVSLYDHLRVTAAIADCLHQYSQNKGFDESFEENDNHKLHLKMDDLPVLLACIDLSGIQSFIYDISDARAAKSLKGRSFYLQLVIDTILDKLIIDNHLTQGHIVYSSGGKAYILLPNTKEVKENFRKVHQKIMNHLIDSEEQSLYVCMDYMPFSFASGSGKLGISYQEENTVKKTNSLGNIWQLLNEKTSRQKQQKFATVLENRFEDFFQPREVKSQEIVCAVSGISLKSEEAENIGSDETPVYVSKTVNKQIKLGTTLKDADYLITYTGDKELPQFNNNKKNSHFEIFNLGVHKYLFDDLEVTFDDADFRSITSFDFCRVERINNTEFNKVNTLKGKEASYGYSFYGGNKQAIDKECDKEKELKTHDKLAGKGSFKRLGVLRMDVDNLGQIFINGLPEEQRNFATYSTLSTQLDIFFSGYLNTIRDKDFSDWVNILYSGGDDIFAIGRWDKVVDFAIEVRQKFKAFVGERTDISISGGVSIVGGKFPISKVADYAGDAEELAKHYGEDLLQGKEATKNAFSLFGIALSWDDLDKAKDQKDQFVGLSERGLVTSSYLQKIVTFYEHKINNPEDLSYVWNTAYYLTRYNKRHKENGKTNRELEDLKNKIVTEATNDHYWNRLVVAARWAELTIRTEEK